MPYYYISYVSAALEWNYDGSNGAAKFFIFFPQFTKLGLRGKDGSPSTDFAAYGANNSWGRQYLSEGLKSFWGLVPGSPNFL